MCPVLMIQDVFTDISIRGDEVLKSQVQLKKVKTEQKIANGRRSVSEATARRCLGYNGQY